MAQDCNSLCCPPKRATTKHAKATQKQCDVTNLTPHAPIHTYLQHTSYILLTWRKTQVSEPSSSYNKCTDKKIIPKVPMIKNSFLPCRTSSGSLSGSGWWLSRLWRWTCGRRDWKDNTHFIRGALSSTVEVGSSLTISGFEQRQWRDPQTKLYHAQWILEQFTLVLGQNTFYS